MPINRFRQLYLRPRERQPLGWVVLFVVIHLLAILLLQLVLSSEWMQDKVYDVNDSRLFDMIAEVPPGYFLLAAVVLAPLWEEVAFRLWMNVKSWTVPIFTTVASFFLVSVFSQLAAWLVAGVVLVLTLLNLVRVKDHISRHFQYWFYGSAVIFGLIHLGNYQLTVAAIPFTLPQMIAGLAIGFMRIQRGFWSGVLVHALWNGALTLVVLVPYFDTTPRVVETAEFRTEWNTGSMWSWGSSVYYGSDSIQVENQVVEQVIATIIGKDNPGILVVTEGVTLSRINAVATGDMNTAVPQLIRAWMEAYDLEIDTLEQREEVYVLYPLEDCKDSADRMYFDETSHDLLTQTASGPADEISTLLSEIYEVQVYPEGLKSAKGVTIPVLPDNINSALTELETRYCIGHKKREETVIRMVIRAPDM